MLSLESYEPIALEKLNLLDGTIIYRPKEKYLINVKDARVHIIIRMDKDTLMPLYVLKYLDKFVQYCYWCYFNNVYLKIKLYKDALNVKTLYDLESRNFLYHTTRHGSPVTSLLCVMETIFTQYNNFQMFTV